MKPGSKQTSEKKTSMISGGTSNSSAGSGPTGSKVDYSKKGQEAAAPNLDASKLNPMNNGKSTYGVGGI